MTPFFLPEAFLLALAVSETKFLWLQQIIVLKNLFWKIIILKNFHQPEQNYDK